MWVLAVKKYLFIFAMSLALILSSCGISESEKTSSNLTLSQIAAESDDNASEKSISTSNTYMENLMSINPWNENEVLSGRFIDLLGEGTANVLDDKKAFAMISEGGEMGKEGWSIAYTENGDKGWFQCKSSFFEQLGYKDFAILENGKIIHFLFATATQSAENLNPHGTEVQILSFNEKTENLDAEELENWFDIFNFEDNISFAVTDATYIGNYTLSLTIEKMSLEDKGLWVNNNTGDFLYHGNVVLDSKTLLPKELKEIESDSESPSEPETAEEERHQAETAKVYFNENENMTYEEELCTIDPWSRFLNDRAKGEANEITFLELLINNRANVIGNGKAYAITSNDSAGMHQTTGIVYYTNDGGKTWEDIDYYNRVYGTESLVSLENGKILSFYIPDSNIIHEKMEAPLVTELSINTEEKSLEKNGILNWFDIFNIDKALKLTEIYYIGADEDDGYVLKIKLESNDEKDNSEIDSVLYDGYVVIDSETLLPVKTFN